MSTTVDLACTACAWVDKDNPTTNYHGAASYELQGGDDGMLLLSFETLPQEYWGYKVDSVNLIFTSDQSLQTTKLLNAYELADGFDESTVTYETKPAISNIYSYIWSDRGTGTYQIAFDVTGEGSSPKNIHSSLHAPAFMFSSTTAPSGGDYLRIYTEYAASGYRPILRVAVSSLLLSVSATGTYPPGDAFTTFQPDEDITASWDLTSTNGYGYGPVQSSAVFKWRLSTEETWNEIAVSGSDQFLTIPAYTLPAHGRILWKVDITCYGGKTASTTLDSFRIRILVELAMTGAAGVRYSDPNGNFSWEQAVYKSLSALDARTLTENIDLFMFERLPAAYAYNAIISGGFYCKVFPRSEAGSEWVTGVVNTLANTFVPNGVTYNTMPAVEEKAAAWGVRTADSATMQQFPTYVPDSGDPDNAGDTVNSLEARLFAKAKALQLQGPQYFLGIGHASSLTVWAPMTLRLWFTDETVTSKPAAAVNGSGYVNPHVEQTFAWDLVPDGNLYCVGDWTQASATFSFRQGTSGPWDTIAVSGSDQFVRFAADTLEPGTVQWKVETTDTEGTTAESEIYEITTTDSATTATPIVPKETVENGDQPIRFIWETANDHDTEPTGADLQMSNNGSSWSTLAQIQTSATQYDAPAGTFSTGTRYWRVRAYNADGVAGAWSDPVTFVVVAAPPAPVVSADGKPYATISWQSSGQMAYRVTVDGKLYGPYFGTAKSFETPDFLSDGSHTAEVSVQGEAGLWSQPGSVTFSVSNIPGDPVSLTGKYGRDAALRWSTEATVANFYVYRDGIRIGHTAAKQFTDRFVLGAHEYFIINKLPGGYYTRSNLSSGTMRSCTRAVAAFSGSGWLEMALSDESDTTEEFAWNQVVSERYVTGSDLPVVETSPYRSGSGSYRISFKDPQTGAAFEALRGQKVIVKSRGGNVAIGVLSGYTKTMGNFYINYTFSVRSCSWEDYVDETGD